MDNPDIYPPDMYPYRPFPSPDKVGVESRFARKINVNEIARRGFCFVYALLYSAHRKISLFSLQSCEQVAMLSNWISRWAFRSLVPRNEGDDARSLHFRRDQQLERKCWNCIQSFRHSQSYLSVIYCSFFFLFYSSHSLRDTTSLIVSWLPAVVRTNFLSIAIVVNQGS